MKNKYEDIRMIDLENIEDIADLYIDCLYNTDKTVGMIANFELINYVFEQLLDLDETSVMNLDFVDCDPDDEFMLKVNDYGHITAVPLDFYERMSDCDPIFISMEGDVSQCTIDWYVNNDNRVILFGLEDEENEESETTCLDTSDSESTYVSRGKDGTPLGFTKSWSTSEDGVTCYSSYSHYSNDLGMLKDIASKFGVKL